MDSIVTAQDYLAKYGIKPSVQRIAIMEYLMEHRTHPSTDEIHSVLIKWMPTLSKTTVYNTLKLFTEQGALMALGIDDRNIRYDIDVSDIEVKTNLPDAIEAPIVAGTKVGTADLIYNGQYLSTIDLVASETVNRNDFLYIVAMIAKVITSKWFLISVSIIIVLLVIYLIISLLHNKKRNRRKVKKYRSF